MLINHRVLVGSLALSVSAGCAVDSLPSEATDDSEAALAVHHNAIETNNALGTVATVGTIDLLNPFFLPLGSNGRACVHCHVIDQGWSITPAAVQQRFDLSKGADPIFRLNDGAVSPNADVSTPQKQRAAYSLLLNRGLIRVGLPIPANAEFALVAVDDPYGFASAAELSLFRRPLPTTNLPFLSTRMWDGRESNLTQQAADAVLGHAQGQGIDPQQMDAIVAFETQLFTAQVRDRAGGDLDKQTDGGPAVLAQTPFFLGINDPLGGNPTGAAFDPVVFTLFDNFAPPAKPKKGGADQRRYSIFRGQQIFNTRPVMISGVAGLNDLVGQPTIQGTCTTCHDTPNVGNHSLPLQVDLGLSAAARRTPDMPLYTLENLTTHQRVQTTDPGRALLTGKWADISKFKGPILRGLASRAPYFHNGSAANLDEAVNFYNTRFGLGLSPQEHQDLVAFLQAL
jgi:cytochrome c peroxidase